MKSSLQKYKSRLNRVIKLMILIIMSTTQLKSQTQVSTIDGGNTSGSYYSYNSITLLPGFSTQPGGSFHAYIMSAPIANCVPLNLSLSQNQNYVVTYTPRAPFQNASLLPNQNVCDMNVNIQYFDGLGRPIQSVTVKGSPDASKDMVQAMQYDAFGRESIKYQPYTSTSNNGSYKTDAFAAQAGFYNSPPTGVKPTAFPYSQTIFESSPLNRVKEQGAPGSDWQPVPNQTTGHTMKMEYGTNIGGEVKLWVVNGSGATGTTNYNANELYKTVSKDENWKEADIKAGTTEEFKDKEGRVILKRVWETNTKSLSTYYVYDDLGNLRYVLPPAVNDNGQAPISSFTDNDSNFNNFIYGYKYDGRRRLIEKKIPGKGWEYMVYNKLDQIVLTQDPKQRSASQWLFTKYDGLGRVIATGLYTDGANRASLQSTVDAEPNNYPLWDQRDAAWIGYTNNSFPRSIAYFHQINYYDDYNFPDNTFGGVTGSQSNMTKGLPTGTKTTVLGTGTMLLSTIYYDSKGRVIQSKSVNYVSGTDVVDNTYSFVGEILTSNRTHIGNGQTTTIANTYAYDHVGRKKQTQQSINGVAPIILSQQNYNEIGELKDKTVGNGLNTTQYSYNERGWMKTMSSPIFSEELKYQDAVNGVTPQYNGNISNQMYTNLSSKTFDYSYDKLNRLLSGVTVGMSEQLTYDVMGNISTLNRNNAGISTYSYSGNQLQGINGLSLSTGTYVYDQTNGNVETDGRNGKTIAYNYLNLPATVSGGLSYTYDATGQKLKKISPSGTIDYVQGIQYKNNAIEFIQTEEGIARKSGGSYSYEYNQADHLGNVRVSYYRNPNSGQREVLQRDDYYAFGKRNSVTPGSNDNKYLYNGKELQDELGQYDYGARFYDAEIGRWNVIDPLAYKMSANSPYSFCFDNPLKFIDFDGAIPTPIEGARIAGHIYDGKVGDVLQGGWRLDKVYTSKENSAYRSGLYSRTINGVTEYAMANAGTYFENSKRGRGSLSEDVEQPFGSSENMKVSIATANQVSNDVGDAELTFVGHSKGGAEAAGNALATNRNALLYNPAAINADKYGLDTKTYTGADKNGMTAYVVKGDMLNSFINQFFAKPIDKAVYLPQQSKNPVTNHLIDAMINAIQEWNKTNGQK